MIEPRATLIARAARLFRDGPVEAAITAHRALLETYPESPDIWYNLALLERAARRPAASLAALDEALTRGITDAEQVWMQRGVVLSEDLHELEGARAALGRAIAIAPDYVPALLNLGNLEEDTGDRAAAEAKYRAALAVEPEHPLALARLAGVAEVAAGDSLLDTLRCALRRVQGNLLAEADLGFALGAVLDRIGDYDAAFDAYLAANWASRKFASSQRKRYDRAAHERWIDRLIAATPQSAKRNEMDAPLFMCGMVRSGSTLVEQMLARHDAFVAGGELDVIPALAARIATYPEAIETLDDKDREALVASYGEETHHLRRDGRRLIDKRPDNIFHLALIRSLFPDARIVRTVRAPIDNALSAFFLHADPTLSWATDLSDIAHYIIQERRLAAHARVALGSAMHEIHYEQLVTDPRAEIAALLDFCGLEWDEHVLDPSGGSGAVKTASVWQVREPIHRRSSGRWRNYAHRLGDLGLMLGEMA